LLYQLSYTGVYDLVMNTSNESSSTKQLWKDILLAQKSLVEDDGIEPPTLCL
jgi:hypothetical protein